MRLPEEPGSPVDKIIREAMAEGKFDRLEGQGRPLAVDPPGHERAPAFRILKNAGFSPEWVDLEAGIEQAREADAAEVARFATEHGAAVAQIQGLRQEWRAAAAPDPGTLLARLLHRAPAPACEALAERLSASVDRLNAARERALARHLRRLHETNRLVDRLNLIMPARGRQLLREDVARAGAEFAGRFPLARLGAPSPRSEEPPALEWAPGTIPEGWLRPQARAEERGPRRVRGEVQVEALVEYRRHRSHGR